jgi:hypothetical protein
VDAGQGVSRADKVVLVQDNLQLQDNLNIHGPHSLYQAFAPQEARRLIERIEWHYTPRHGSWLNMAEIELSVLARQCLTGTHGQPAPPRTTHAGLARAPQPDRNPRSMALHHPGHPHQAQETLSLDTTGLDH